jgi:hypothetical protein
MVAVSLLLGVDLVSHLTTMVFAAVPAPHAKISRPLSRVESVRQAQIRAQAENTDVRPGALSGPKAPDIPIAVLVAALENAEAGDRATVEAVAENSPRLENMAPRDKRSVHNGAASRTLSKAGAKRTSKLLVASVSPARTAPAKKAVKTHGVEIAATKVPKKSARHDNTYAHLATATGELPGELMYRGLIAQRT